MQRHRARQAIRRRPDCAPAYYIPAIALARAGRIDEARTALSKCDDLHAGFVDTRKLWQPYVNPASNQKLRDALRLPGPRPTGGEGPKPVTPIFHICRRDEWAAAQAAASYTGSSQDAADGFIHFSTAAQVPASAAKHRAGQTVLVLVAVGAEALGEALRWEASRGGDLFPHLYGPLPLAAVRWVKPLPLGANGRHDFPPLTVG